MATLKDGRIQVKADSAHYRDLVQNALPELSSRPERFLAQLPRKFHSDYFFATEPHEDADCPFAHGTRVVFEQHPRAAEPLDSPRRRRPARA